MQDDLKQVGLGAEADDESRIKKYAMGMERRHLTLEYFCISRRQNLVTHCRKLGQLSCQGASCKQRTPSANEIEKG